MGYMFDGNPDVERWLVHQMDAGWVFLWRGLWWTPTSMQSMDRVANGRIYRDFQMSVTAREVPDGWRPTPAEGGWIIPDEGEECQMVFETGATLWGIPPWVSPKTEDDDG